MSGGCYDYFSYKVDEIAESLRNTESDPRRAAFQELLCLISTAMHDIEWVDSCDYVPGDDHKAIDAVFDFLRSSPEIIKKAHAYDVLRDKLLEFLK